MDEKKIQNVDNDTQKNCVSYIVDSELEKKKTILSYFRDLTGLLAGVLLIFVLVFRVVVVSGSSMNSTLISGDYVLLLNNVLCSEPKQGDIIVASKDSFEGGDPIIKRVIATEGQTVRIENHTVYVDGVALVEDYIAPNTLYSNYPEITVSEGHLFVMGDNRMNSKDSRSSQIGLIDCREVLGKALIIVFPGEDAITKERDFSRFGGID